MELFRWQEEFLRGATAVRADEPDRWAAREVGLVVPRQNGKGSVLEARQLAGLFVFKERLQLHSAHEFKTCYEHFRRVVALVESNDLLRKQVKIIRTGAGDQSVELKDGCRIRFIARSRSSGRGFSADAVYLDEAFELSDETVGALLPALSARPNSQIWYTSSAPHANSVVLHRVVSRIRAAKDGDRFYGAEWSNTPDVDPADPEAWQRANPSFGVLIQADDIQSEQHAMSPTEFARERLGIPDEQPSDRSGPVPLDRWNALIDGESTPLESEVRLCLDAPPDRMSADFTLAGKRADNLRHVEVRDHIDPTRMPSLVSRAKELTDGHGTPLIIPPGSPAESWVAELEAAGVPLDRMKPSEYAAACGYIVAAVQEGNLRHRGQPELTNAVAGLATRNAGDVEVWARRSSSSNIAPFVGVTCALARLPVAGTAKVEPYVFFS